MENLEECIVCGTSYIRECVNLGYQPLANNLKDTKEEPSDKYPLIVNECFFCGHKQLSVAVDPVLLFSNYKYKTGVSDEHRRYFDKFAQDVTHKQFIGENSKILDIGCNDGSLLDSFKKRGWRTYGIDPASDIVDNVEHIVIKGFFPIDGIKKKFNVITAFNVFAHNSDPVKFLEGMRDLLEVGGRIYIQTTLARLDSYYHEHVSYFNPESMNKIVNLCGLELRGFKEVTMHSRSYLFEISHPEVNDMHQMDHLKNINSFVGYGASANGIVLMNYLDLQPEYVVDDNPMKQDKFIPGVNVPIYNSDRLANDRRDLKIVVFAYNLYDEIVGKIKRLRPNKNDVFIDPRGNNE